MCRQTEKKELYTRTRKVPLSRIAAEKWIALSAALGFLLPGWVLLWLSLPLHLALAAGLPCGLVCGLICGAMLQRGERRTPGRAS